MTIDDAGPSSCDTYLDEALGFVDAAIEVLDRETAFGYNYVVRQLKEVKRNLREAQADLVRELNRHAAQN